MGAFLETRSRLGQGQGRGQLSAQLVEMKLLPAWGIFLVILIWVYWMINTWYKIVDSESRVVWVSRRERPQKVAPGNLPLAQLGMERDTFAQHEKGIDFLLLTKHSTLLYSTSILHDQEEGE